MSSTVCRNRSRGQVSAARQRGLDAGRIRAGPDLSDGLPHHQSGGGRHRPGRVSRFRRLAQTRPAGQCERKWAYAYGSSQSGRFLRTFLYDGFNADEKGRQVFDGVMAHIAGAARLSINEPSATPNALSMYTRDRISVCRRRDARSGERRSRKGCSTTTAPASINRRCSTRTPRSSIGAAADRPRSSTPRPTASRISRCRTTCGSISSPARSTRRPAFRRASRPASRPTTRSDYWWTLRALLMAMDSGCGRGRRRRPASIRGSRMARWWPPLRSRFRPFPGVRVAAPAPAGPAGRDAAAVSRAAGGSRTATSAPASARPRSACRSRPTPGGTSASPSIGGPELLVSLMGSSVPFAATKASKAPSDPRRSIDERYPSHERYTELAKSAAAALVSSGYLLADDVPQVMQRAEDEWTNARQVAGSR